MANPFARSGTFGTSSTFGGGSTFGQSNAFSSPSKPAFGGGSTFGGNTTNAFGGGNTNSAFTTPQKTNPFGGSSTTSAFGGGGSTFGSGTKPNPFGGNTGGSSMFGGNSNTTSTFGQSKTTFGGSTTNTNPFGGGTSSTFGKPAASPFGGNNTTTSAFGQNKTGFGQSSTFGGNNTSSFGGNTQSTFGQTKSAFGGTPGFGGSSFGTNNNAGPKYTPVTVTVQDGNNRRRLTEKIVSISGQFKNDSTSQEELRWNYYQAKAGGAAPAANSPFGASATTNTTPFGQSATTNTNPFGGGQTTSFGTPAKTNPFGGGATTNTNPFGGGGATTNPFGGGAAKPNPFGGGTTTATNPFGGGAAKTNPFGGGATTATNPFGGGAAKTNPFGGGTTTATNPFGGGAAKTNPFGGGATTATNPFGGGAAKPNPFGGGTTTATNPFGGGAAKPNPFGGGTTATNPFGGGAAKTNPFGGGTTTATNPFGGGAAKTNPFGGGATTTTNPFGGGAATTNPFGGGATTATAAATAANPFGAAQPQLPPTPAVFPEVFSLVSASPYDKTSVQHLVSSVSAGLAKTSRSSALDMLKKTDSITGSTSSTNTQASSRQSILASFRTPKPIQLKRQNRFIKSRRDQLRLNDPQYKNSLKSNARPIIKGNFNNKHSTSRLGSALVSSSRILDSSVFTARQSKRLVLPAAEDIVSNTAFENKLMTPGPARIDIAVPQTGRMGGLTTSSFRTTSITANDTSSAVVGSVQPSLLERSLLVAAKKRRVTLASPTLRPLSSEMELPNVQTDPGLIDFTIELPDLGDEIVLKNIPIETSLLEVKEMIEKNDVVLPENNFFWYNNKKANADATTLANLGVANGDLLKIGFDDRIPLPNVSSSQPDILSDILDNESKENLASSPKTVLPILKGKEYSCVPSLDEMKHMSSNDLKHVDNFTLIHEEFGEICWTGQTNVIGLDLDNHVAINKKEVVVYDGIPESIKPEVGAGLNKPAEITLRGIFPPNPAKTASFTAKVQRIADSAPGMTFISYDPLEGVWKFRVEHF